MEGGDVDGGGERVVGGGFGEREERLDVVVAVFERQVGQGKDGGEGSPRGVRGVDGGVVEADDWGGWRGGGHGEGAWGA